MRATQAGVGPIVFATDKAKATTRQAYLQKVAAMRAAGHATTRPAAPESAPAPKPTKPPAQPILGTIRVRDGRGTRTVTVVGVTAAEPSGLLRAPQFGLRGKTLG